MARRQPPDPKAEALRSRGCFHARPDAVTDALFVSDDFFDPRDLVQLKYEMLRRSRVDGVSVAASAAAFGFSRPTFYQAQAAFEDAGVHGLVPSKPGPRHAHKLADEIVDFLEAKLAGGERPGSVAMAELVKKHFDREVHPRSIERALARREKKLRQPPSTRR